MQLSTDLKQEGAPSHRFTTEAEALLFASRCNILSTFLAPRRYIVVQHMDGYWAVAREGKPTDRWQFVWWAYPGRDDQ